MPQGTSSRPLRQAAVSHAAELAWLPMMTFTIIAPIISTLNSAM